MTGNGANGAGAGGVVVISWQACSLPQVCSAGSYLSAPSFVAAGSAAYAAVPAAEPTRQYFRFASTSGTNTFSFPKDTTAQVLVVGGGGAGGARVSGGGGAGGLIYHAAYTFAANVLYTVTVGAGGTGGSTTHNQLSNSCLLYTSPSPRDRTRSRMPSSA